MAETTPFPGIRTVAQQSAQISARPTAGESQDHSRRPQSAIAAWPTRSEEAQTARTDA